MRTELSKTVAGGLLGAWIMCMAGTAIAAQPEQSARGTMPKEVVEAPLSTTSDAVKLNKSVVLAKNTSAKAASTAPATTKTKSPEERKTIGRCWKRLMTMVREVNHAHRNTKK